MARKPAFASRVMTPHRDESADDAARREGDVLRVERDWPRAGCWRLVLDDRPHANALSPALVARLDVSLRDALANGARTIVFDSSGERFCAGFDLRDIETVDDSDLRARFEALEALLESVRRAPALTIACVRGAALGAGADLVAACDYRIGTASARFAFPGNRFGVVLGTRHLASVVGRQAALEILVEGKTLDADYALRCGLLSEACSEEALAARVSAIEQHCETIDVETLRAMLRLVREAPSDSDRQALVASVSRTGVAKRAREYARRTREARRRASP
jgi:enoyl-CoA hydratase/carnithine racemase